MEAEEREQSFKKEYTVSKMEKERTLMTFLLHRAGLEVEYAIERVTVVGGELVTHLIDIIGVNQVVHASIEPVVLKSTVRFLFSTCPLPLLFVSDVPASC